MGLSSNSSELDFEQIRVKNPERARYLLGVPAISEVFSAAESVALAEKTRTEMLASIQALGFVPVGGVIAWHKHLAVNMPPLPDNFRELDGQVINDPASPLHGVTLPDWNGEGRFLKGSSASGGTGGSTTHAHLLTSLSTAAFDQNLDGTQAAAVVSNADSTDVGGSEPPYAAVVWVIRIK
jgi:hypothetical protein